MLAIQKPPIQASSNESHSGSGAWHSLSEDMQLQLAREAMRRAAETLANEAELLAADMDEGVLLDRDGPEALRLFASVVRSTNRRDNRKDVVTIGNA
jgi:hypothetical protein